MNFVTLGEIVVAMLSYIMDFHANLANPTPLLWPEVSRRMRVEMTCPYWASNASTSFSLKVNGRLAMYRLVGSCSCCWEESKDTMQITCVTERYDEYIEFANKSETDYHFNFHDCLLYIAALFYHDYKWMHRRERFTNSKLDLTRLQNFFNYFQKYLVQDRKKYYIINWYGIVNKWWGESCDEWVWSRNFSFFFFF